MLISDLNDGYACDGISIIVGLYFLRLSRESVMADSGRLPIRESRQCLSGARVIRHQSRIVLFKGFHDEIHGDDLCWKKWPVNLQTTHPRLAIDLA